VLERAIGGLRDFLRESPRAAGQKVFFRMSLAGIGHEAKPKSLSFAPSLPLSLHSLPLEEPSELGGCSDSLGAWTEWMARGLTAIKVPRVFSLLFLIVFPSSILREYNLTPVRPLFPLTGPFSGSNLQSCFVTLSYLSPFFFLETFSISVLILPQPL